MTDADRQPPRRDSRAAATEAWLLMGDLVLDNTRRREVSEATGLSFARTRALRRLARRPMSMSELAAALEIDKPNATTVVDELEALGLVRRTPHPTDRRAKVVETTPAGNELAARADEILGTPPRGLNALDREQIDALRALLKQVVAAQRGD